MAKIWPVYEGKEPTRGDPWADVPVAEAIRLFQLRPDYLQSGLSSTPRFGDAERDLWYAGFRHVLVEISEREARSVKWKPGFYKSPVKPKAAYEILVRRALISELGEQNIIRVEIAPAVTSDGLASTKITAVVRPDAVNEIDDVVLDALVHLRQGLAHMGVPVVEFATEAELKQGAGP